MASKVSLQTALLQVAVNVYFQPPEALLMVYPCIVYKRSSGKSSYAGNLPYLFDTCYDVTVIARTPDCSIVTALEKFPKSRLARNFTSNNLHHDVFTIYY